MTEEKKETLSLEPQKRAPGRPPKKTRKYKRGDNTKTWDFVPPELIPEGMSVEWKNISVYGQEVESDYTVRIHDQGWEPANPAQFKAMLPEGWSKNTIDRRGQRLYIRPQELTDEAKAEEKAAANEQLRGKLEQLGMAPKQGQFQQKVEKFNRTYERVEVPKD